MSYLDSADGFKPKDLVFVGDPAPLDRKIVWRVVSLARAANNVVYATLRSGQTERSRTVPTTQLSHFRATEKAA